MDKADVRLVATDMDWQHGEGSEVSGPIMALVMTMTGRRAALECASGEGETVLSGRCR